MLADKLPSREMILAELEYAPRTRSNRSTPRPARGAGNCTGRQPVARAIQNAGLDLEPAANAVEAGIFACEQLFSGGMLKAFASLSNWYSEFRMYRRDQDGRVVKEFDHLLDAMRYLILSGRDRMTTRPQKPEPQIVYYTVPRRDGLDWMAR